jgi:uncharacterized membrane protein
MNSKEYELTEMKHSLEKQYDSASRNQTIGLVVILLAILLLVLGYMIIGIILLILGGLTAFTGYSIKHAAGKALEEVHKTMIDLLDKKVV